MSEKEYYKRGYYVQESGAVYHTLDMDKTVDWFKKTLGWYATIDERDSSNKGLYGCLFDLPNGFEELHIAPFRGIHMFYGEPSKQRITVFIKTRNIETMHKYIIDSGWTKVTDVVMQPWGAKAFDLETVDECIIKVFE